MIKCPEERNSCRIKKVAGLHYRCEEHGDFFYFIYRTPKEKSKR